MTAIMTRRGVNRPPNPPGGGKPRRASQLYHFPQNDYHPMFPLIGTICAVNKTDTIGGGKLVLGRKSVDIRLTATRRIAGRKLVLAANGTNQKSAIL
jgi:hypothetical protein